MADEADSVPTEIKVSEGDSSSTTSLRKRQSVVIGRDFACDIVIRDAKASRRHCRLTRRENGFLLEDLNSKNGTYFDGERITTPVELRSNQAFKIGDTIFYLA